MKKNSNHTSLEEGEPAWDAERLLAAKRLLSEEEYLNLDGNYFVEFSQGRIDLLPSPTTSHQRLLACLYELLAAVNVRKKLGVVLIGPLPVRLGPGEFREPDILFVLRQHYDLMGERFWTGADLVMEIVSPGAKSRRRDLKEKRRDYAKAGIPEYWVVDQRQVTITVLRLVGESYSVHGEFARGEIATSHLLPGFTVDVTAAFDTQKPEGVKPTKAKRRPKA
ncbi:MAG TPA: Uma2 family endonuclease [Planctomycetales bacterium]|jgi:Uma2 family endonuclease|nr:Uma2 family endonuclease [Planctomycetales bacterium]